MKLGSKCRGRRIHWNFTCEYLYKKESLMISANFGYSRVPNKRTGTFIKFWKFFVWVRPYLGGYVYSIWTFCFSFSFSVIFNCFNNKVEWIFSRIFSLFCSVGTFIKGGTFIHFCLIVQGVRLLGRVRLFGKEPGMYWVRFVTHVEYLIYPQHVVQSSKCEDRSDIFFRTTACPSKS